jgi:hypothetical protein
MANTFVPKTGWPVYSGWAFGYLTNGTTPVQAWLQRASGSRQDRGTDSGYDRRT